MVKENEHLKEKVVSYEFQLKKMELDYTSILNAGQNHYESAKRCIPDKGAVDSSHDQNLELIKVCKEVNKSYLTELNCVYSLLHDTFVSELTGTGLRDLIRKRLEDENKFKFQGPL